MSWTPRQRKFIEWLATPKSMRTPPTHEEFADVIGVTSRTLRTWKKLEGFWDEVFNLAGFHLGDWLAEIYNVLGKTAADGNVSAMRLALEAAGLLGSEQQLTQNVNIQPFTVEELAAAAAASEAWNSEVSESAG